MILDHERLEEFIDQIALIPAIYENKEYGVEKEQMSQIWEHLGHTFQLSETEAENQWNFLVRLHRYMHPKLPDSSFRLLIDSETAEGSQKWTDAEVILAQTLKPFFQHNLDKILLK